MIYKAIAAIARNGVICCGLKIPWHISEDFKHFKRTTTGGIIVMGRRTWESLGKRPLPNRENVVITSRPEDVQNGARAFKSLDEFESAFADDSRTVWIIGGAKLYETALPRCEEIVVSKIKASPQGDVFCPDISNTFEEKQILEQYDDFDVVLFKRKYKG